MSSLIASILYSPATTKRFYEISSDIHYMEPGKLHHDQHTASTDHQGITPKCRGKVLVEKTIALADSR
ncbi:MAG: hypothetical protein C5S52_04730 [ANME-2 cluster archaeon]|nr:hypothetical protein [ANME-2 cluster archaeon]